MLRSIFILIIIFPIFCFGQVKINGTPNIQNYPKSLYNAGTQNWGIAQDKNGFMYFANNDGVLRFDGLHWDLIKVSQSSPVRSIFIDEENNIYIGLFNDFGILEVKDNGFLQFKSLKNLLPEGTADFDDIWRICKIKNEIIFQTFEYLFVLNNNKIEVVKPQKSFHFSFNTNNRLFLHEPGVGIFEYSNGINRKLKWSEELKDNDICSVIEIQDNQLLIGTESKGIYLYEDGKLNKWSSKVNVLAEQNKLFCAVKIADDYLAFGTILNGIVISDNRGNIVQHIDRSKGLQNNTVLTIFPDKSNNLWLGLDNGIDYVEIDSPITFIADFEKLGTGYCCRVFNGNLYIGTNQGLHVQSFYDFENNSESKFDLVENTAGQVWSLNEFDGQLICGHNSGTFVINGKSADNIANQKGAWRYIRLKKNPDYLLGGTYNGLVLLKKGTNGWEFFKQIEGFNESSRFLTEDLDGKIWISHGAKGIYKVTLTKNMEDVQDFNLYTSKDGLPDDENNILFQFKGNEYVSTVEGIYAYDNETDTFLPDTEINKIFNINGRIKTIETDLNGNIWFISESESGVLRLNEDLTYTKITAPFKQLDGKYVNEFEFVYPHSDEHVFFGMDLGFAHYTSKVPKLYTQSFQSFITKVELPYIDSVLFQLDSTINYEYPFRKNEFRFHYTAPFFESYDNLKFSYFLENFSEKWSDWSPYSFKDFTNLHEGRYIFKLKALNIYGIESEMSTFSFTIKPPWHRSKLAYYLYLLLFLLITFAFVKFLLYRFKLAKQKEKMRHLQELERKKEKYRIQEALSEKEIIKLRNEKLRAEKAFRDKELANQTMSIIQKNRFLIKLNDELRLLQNSTEDDSVRTKITILKRRIKKETDNDQQNKIFETYFDEVHEDFFNRLKEKYPKLSPADLRLCAYIKMNISTKEISALLNISYRGVEISRYRLRKKLELSRDINLSTFLLNI